MMGEEMVRAAILDGARLGEDEGSSREAMRLLNRPGKHYGATSTVGAMTGGTVVAFQRDWSSDWLTRASTSIRGRKESLLRWVSVKRELGDACPREPASEKKVRRGRSLFRRREAQGSL